MQASTATGNEEPVTVKKKIIENGFYCDVCEKVFSSRAHARTHKPAHLFLRKLKCSHCAKRFYQTHHLKKHEATHSSARPYACEICKRAFKVESNMKLHMAVHTREASHECPDCGFKFHQAGALTRHYRSIHLHQQFYECNVCKTKFNRKETLRSHLDSHRMDNPFSCKPCGMLFPDNSQLVKHTKAHHLVIKVPKSSQSQQS
ncbi:finger 85 [Octopus vulgaris]|uniref:Finger 85 n=1 Tax=Octopus vulgaris TaxID=6645 RepID=A0AA36BFD9_OCTVU|nr:finger 85 [Octopus vulgaris]